MKKIFSTLAFILIVGYTSANCGSSIDISETGVEHIKISHLKANLNFLASDELEGRETGKRGLKIAAKFLETQFKMYGLKPAPGAGSMVQKFDVSKNRILSSSKITLPGQPKLKFKNYRDFLVLSKVPKTIDKNYQLVYVGYGLQESDYKNKQVKNKLVMILDTTPEIRDIFGDKDIGVFNYKLRRTRKDKAELAGKFGAAGIIYVNDLPTYLNFAQNRRRVERVKSTLSYENPLLEIVVSSRLANKLLAGTDSTLWSLKNSLADEDSPIKPELKQGIHLKINVKSKIANSQNVIAYLEGSDEKLKHEYVVIGAHYDHLGTKHNGLINNGADDNGSGTAGLMEIARVYAENPKPPKRSLIFIAHAGEESGLLGSKHFTNTPLIPLENVITHLNMDMIGRNDANSVYVIGSNFLSKDLHEINEDANDIVKLRLDYLYNSLNDPNRFYYRSDHYNYAKNNIPVIFYFSGTHQDYHQPTDTVDKIDFEKVSRVAKLVFLTSWNTANAAERPKLNGLLLEN